MNKLVSCIVPTFNRSKLLKEAIESTLSQTYPHWEMIIVDDKSTDDTAEIATAYQAKDPRIIYFLNPDKGVSSARNFGIQMARGEFIAFLDDDDINLPHRFESQLNAMLKSGSRFLVSGFQSRERATGKILNEQKLELKATCTGFPSRWMIKKDLLNITGGFDQKAAPLEDIELSARMAIHEIFTLHDDIVSVTFLTENSASSATAKKVMARILLLERTQNQFLPPERAWWQFCVATDYYMMGNKDGAMEYLLKAAEGDPRGLYRIAYMYFKRTKALNGTFKKINLKVLSFLREYNLPVLVNHKVVRNQ
jgi:glycosyltransferase involved in cell wall biosynthesis